MVEFYRCLRCSNKFTVHRQRGQKRRKNHIKTMWCVRCRKRTPYKKCV